MPNRSVTRRFGALLLAPFAAACGAFTTSSVEVDEEAARSSFYDLDATSLEGEPVDLSTYAGQVTLVVNTASQCGYTGQYEGLQTLQDTYGERGFSVLGFPSGDFGGQEYDSAEEIRSFCTNSFAVSFPLFAKSGVKAGDGQSEVFAFLSGATGSLPNWNFGKYLVAKDGTVLAFFPTPTKPTSDTITDAIESALAS